MTSVDKIETTITVANDASYLDRFICEIKIMKDDVKTVEKLRKKLNEGNEKSKTILDAAKMKEVRALMDSDIDHVLILFKTIKKRAEGLEFMSSNKIVDRNRIFVVMGLGKKLMDMMDEFQGLRLKMAVVYKEIVEHKYCTITGTNHYLETIENLTSGEEIEDYLKAAIQEHGKDRIMDFIEEMQERREGSKNMQRNLVELHQTFLDMVALLDARCLKMAKKGGRSGENQVARGNSFVKPTGARPA